MKYFKLLIFFQLILFLYSCSTVKEGFTNQKKSSSDEFLVEKKSPLVMPPDYNDLPVPDQNKETAESNENKIKDLVTKNENENGEDFPPGAAVARGAEGARTPGRQTAQGKKGNQPQAARAREEKKRAAISHLILHA